MESETDHSTADGAGGKGDHFLRGGFWEKTPSFRDNLPRRKHKSSRS
jgi:hypothetical protein